MKNQYILSQRVDNNRTLENDNIIELETKKDTEYNKNSSGKTATALPSPTGSATLRFAYKFTRLVPRLFIL